MPYCSIKLCGKNTKTSGLKKDSISFHRFPKSPEIKEKWLQAIRRENWIPRERNVICSRHFTPDCFDDSKKIRRLFSSAVPTLYLPALISTPDQYTYTTSTAITGSPSAPPPPIHEDFDNYYQWNLMNDRPRLKPIATLRYPEPSHAAISTDSENYGVQDFAETSQTFPQSPVNFGNDSDSEADDLSRDQDEESDISSQFIEHHEIDEDGMPEMIEIKIEPRDEMPVGEVEEEHEIFNAILGSDGGKSCGFGPFSRATSTNLPAIDMFAIIEFLTENNYFKTLDYQKLKGFITPSKPLVSGVRVQSRGYTDRVRCTVHLQTSSECGIEYDITTHTVTRSECMCSCATCEHVAALLMWLHCAYNQNKKQYNPKLIKDNNQTTKKTALQTWNSNASVTRVSDTLPRVSDVISLSRDERDVRFNEPDDPLNVPEVPLDAADIPLNKSDKPVDEQPGPSTAKRKRISPNTTGSYTTQVIKSKSTGKNNDIKTDESVIKCSFTRKCFYNVWRSTKGNFVEKLRHTRSIMTRAFQDPNYVIDFLPLEKRLEELCLEIEGYWNNETNKEGFETKYADWFEDVEYIDMKKTKRDVGLGPSTSLGNVVI